MPLSSNSPCDIPATSIADVERMNDPDPQAAAIRRRQRAVQAVRVGLVVFIVSVVLAASPLLMGSGGPTKYVVALAVVGMCIGLSSVVHGLWDLWRTK